MKDTKEYIPPTNPEAIYFAEVEPWIHSLQEGYYAAHRGKKGDLLALRREILTMLLGAATLPNIPEVCMSLHSTLVQGMALLSIAIYGKITANPESGERLMQVGNNLHRIWVQLERLKDWQAIDEATYRRLVNLPPSQAMTANGKPAFLESGLALHIKSMISPPDLNVFKGN